MSAPYTILLSWPSLCQKLSKLVNIWRRSGKNNFGCFLRHGVHSLYDRGYTSSETGSIWTTLGIWVAGNGDAVEFSAESLKWFLFCAGENVDFVSGIWNVVTFSLPIFTKQRNMCSWMLSKPNLEMLFSGVIIPQKQQNESSVLSTSCTYVGKLWSTNGEK